MLVTLALVGATPAAQTDEPAYPIYTADHLAGTMETLGPNFAGTLQSVDAADWMTAKQRLSRSREQLATTITFWRKLRKDDAVGFVRDALRAMDDLDAAVSTETVDTARAAARAADVGVACAACHAIYREPDTMEGTFRLKTSALD